MARGAILGRSGTGKSWFAGSVLEDALPGDGGSGAFQDEGGEYQPAGADIDLEEDFGHAIHIDVEDEERGFSDADNPVLLTFEVTPQNLPKYVTFGGKRPSYIPDAEFQDGDEVLLVKWVYYKHRYVRAVPNGLTDEELKAMVEMLADAAMKTGDCHFSLDEAHLVAKKHSIGEKLMRLVTGGRKRGVEWLFITQRPQKMHEDILSQTDYTVYFNLRDRDRDKAAEKSEAVPDAERKIDDLEPRQAIIEDFDTGEWGEIDTNDLSRNRPHVSGDDGKADKSYESLLSFDESSSS